jgi:hypothetical protein
VALSSVVSLEVLVLRMEHGHAPFGAEPLHEGLQACDTMVDLMYCSNTHAAIIPPGIGAEPLPNHYLFLTRFFRGLGIWILRRK